jgi:hypothetical protein
VCRRRDRRRRPCRRRIWQHRYRDRGGRRLSVIPRCSPHPLFFPALWNFYLCHLLSVYGRPCNMNCSTLFALAPSVLVVVTPSSHILPFPLPISVSHCLHITISIAIAIDFPIPTVSHCSIPSLFLHFRSSSQYLSTTFIATSQHFAYLFVRWINHKDYLPYASTHFVHSTWTIDWIL